MKAQPKNEKAQSGVKTGPESGEALTSTRIKGQKDSKSRDISEIANEVEATAFGFCKEAVPLISALVWKLHMLDNHPRTVNECDRGYCSEVKLFFTKLDKKLFHGTMRGEMEDVIDMEDLTGVKS